MPPHTTEDTIAALSSPAGSAMRAIIRLSGPEAIESIDPLFKPATETNWQAGFRATSGLFTLPGEQVSVPLVIYVMRAPRSYTRQDVIELHIPGSPALIDMILDALLKHYPDKLRLARPGEFTERAFLNGRIDLSQAEAVMSVITARNRSELLAANARLMGGASTLAENIQNGISELRAATEAALDFDIHGIEITTPEDFLKSCRALREQLEDELEKAQADLASERHISVVLCGPPNAGKSSILNRLSGQDKALVHETAGTTRDAVRETVDIDGVSFTVTDTAGMDKPHENASGPARTPNTVERCREDISALAARHAKNAIRNAHLLILVFDASLPIPGRWRKMARPAEKKQTLCVFNKCDLPQKANPTDAPGQAEDIIHISALNGKGVDKIRNALVRIVTEGGIDASPADCLFNARQRDAVRRAADRLEEAERAVEADLGYEFAAFNLREAAEALSHVTGTVESQDVLNRIFGRFCIGK